MLASTHLLIKVGFSELQRVEQGIGGCQFDVVARLLLPHALDDGGQDLIGVVLQLLWLLEAQGQGSEQSQDSYTVKSWDFQYQDVLTMTIFQTSQDGR